MLLLVSVRAYSQLSVQNSTYIYTNDQLLFVEDDINLNHATSRLFLRNEAQLIQGVGVTGNSGLGELSIYQDGNVGAYEYNYWCAPVGSKVANNTNNPFGISLFNDIVDVTTSIPATTNHSANYNGTASPLNIEPYWIWKYIASDALADWIHVQDNTIINPGEGFTMKGTSGTSANNSGDNQNYDFRGKPNTGIIEVAVANNQFTLTGNPYPSAIDAVAYIHDMNNASIINGTLYYWEQNPDINSHNLSDISGGYASYTINATGTIETYVPAVFHTYNGDGTINSTGIGGPSGTNPQRYIPVGQGFMVEGTASGVLRVNNAHRVYQKESGGNSEFFKTRGINSKEQATRFQTVPSTVKRFRLNIDFNDSHTRQLVQTFTSEATQGFDYGLESKLAEELGKEAYWKSANDSLVAQALSFNENVEIPLEIQLDEQSNIRVRITDIQNFNESLAIYLHDNENSTYTNLRQEDFNIVLESGGYTNRFNIVFNQETLSLTEQEEVNYIVWHNKQQNQIEIYNPQKNDIIQINVYDVVGKRFQNKKYKISQERYNIATNVWSSGVYIVKITTHQKEIYSKKIIIKD